MRVVSILLLGLAATGCGGGGHASGTPGASTTTVQGVVFASAPFNSGNVVAYDFGNGSKGALLQSTPIGADGRYSMTIANPPAAVLLAATGCYSETVYWYPGGPPQAPGVVSTHNPVCLNVPLYAVTPLSGGANTVVAVTPFTHAAYGRVQYDVAHGQTVSAAIADGNGRATQSLGFDVLATSPVTPTTSTTMVNDGTVYGGLLFGIASWLYNEPGIHQTTTSYFVGDTGMSTLDVAEAMRNDVAYDGVLDGNGTSGLGAPAALTIANYPLNTTAYRHGLAKYGVIGMRGVFEDHLNSQVVAIIPFLPSFVGYNNATQLFDASALVPLDEGGPIIGIASPTAGATLTGSAGIDGTTKDITGVVNGNSEVLIDGVHYDNFLDPYHPNHFINTTVFPNGSHILTIRATNNLGTTKSASVTVTFSN